MFDALKYRIARRRALKRVARRPVRPWAADPAERRVLAVLPAGDEAAREAWRFVKSLGVRPDRLAAVVLSGEVSYVPAEYIHDLIRLGEGDLNALGLPRKAFTEGLWAEAPDVAFCLTPAFDLAAALLVGASPARFRVGVYSEEAEPFFDLMVAPEASFASAVHALRKTLGQIEPPVLDLAPVE